MYFLLKAGCPRWIRHTDCDVENKDPFLISTGCQTHISFDQMEYMERCINDKDSFIREVLVEKVTKSDSSVRQYTRKPSLTLLFGVLSIYVASPATSPQTRQRLFTLPKRQPATCFPLTATLAMLAIPVLPVKWKAP